MEVNTQTETLLPWTFLPSGAERERVNNSYRYAGCYKKRAGATYCVKGISSERLMSDCMGEVILILT